MKSKSKEKKHLQFYGMYSILGKLPFHRVNGKIIPGLRYLGLEDCAEDGLIDLEIFRLFMPSFQIRKELYYSGFNAVYFDFGTERASTTMANVESEFDGLRQTIVLFMAAINGEL